MRGPDTAHATAGTCVGDTPVSVTPSAGPAPTHSFARVGVRASSPTDAWDPALSAEGGLVPGQREGS